MKAKKEELAKVEGRLDKEKERANGLEKQFKKALQESDMLDSKLKQFHE
jgi:septal ring factor EnvC (AmiA/AmiB activator)